MNCSSVLTISHSICINPPCQANLATYGLGGIENGRKEDAKRLWDFLVGNILKYGVDSSNTKHHCIKFGCMSEHQWTSSHQDSSASSWDVHWGYRPLTDSHNQPHRTIGTGTTKEANQNTQRYATQESAREQLCFSMLGELRALHSKDRFTTRNEAWVLMSQETNANPAVTCYISGIIL